MLTWLEAQGRDSEGDQYHRLYLVDVDCRVVATIYMPIWDGDTFDCAVLEAPVRRYLIEDAARAYCESKAAKDLNEEKSKEIGPVAQLDRAAAF